MAESSAMVLPEDQLIKQNPTLAKVGSSIQNSNAPDFVKNATLNPPIPTPTTSVAPNTSIPPATTLQNSNAPQFVKDATAKNNAISIPVAPVPTVGTTNTAAGGPEIPQPGKNRVDFNAMAKAQDDAKAANDAERAKQSANAAKLYAPKPTITETAGVTKEIPVPKVNVAPVTENPILQNIAKDSGYDVTALQKPLDDLYQAQYNKSIADQNASIQFNKNQLSQQLAEMEAQGTGVSNGMYRALLRDQDALFSNQRSVLNTNYLNSKMDIAKTAEGYRREDYITAQDNLTNAFLDMKDPDAQIAMAQSMAASDPTNPFWKNMNTPAMQDYLRKSGDKQAQIDMETYRQQSNAIINDKTLDPITQKTTWKDAYIKSLPNIDVIAKAWSDGTNIDAFTSLYGEEKGTQLFNAIKGTGEEGAKQAYLDFAFDTKLKSIEDNGFAKTIKDTMFTNADTDQERLVADNLTKLVSSGVLGDVPTILSLWNPTGTGRENVDATVNLTKDQSVDPAKHPLFGLIFTDWNGNSYNPGNTQDDQPIAYKILDSKWAKYVKDSNYAPTLTREEFKNAYTEKDANGEPQIREDVADKSVKEVVANAKSQLNTTTVEPTALIDMINKGTLTADNISDEQFKVISTNNAIQQEMVKSNAIVELPTNGVDINKSKQGFGPEKLNPPKLMYVKEDGKVVPYKLVSVKMINTTRNKDPRHRIQFNYVDAYGNPRTYGTSYIGMDVKIPEKTINGITVEDSDEQSFSSPSNQSFDFNKPGISIPKTPIPTPRI